MSRVYFNALASCLPNELVIHSNMYYVKGPFLDDEASCIVKMTERRRLFHLIKAKQGRSLLPTFAP